MFKTKMRYGDCENSLHLYVTSVILLFLWPAESAEVVSNCIRTAKWVRWLQLHTVLESFIHFTWHPCPDQPTELKNGICCILLNPKWMQECFQLRKMHTVTYLKLYLCTLLQLATEKGTLIGNKTLKRFSKLSKWSFLSLTFQSFLFVAF